MNELEKSIRQWLSKSPDNYVDLRHAKEGLDEDYELTISNYKNQDWYDGAEQGDLICEFWVGEEMEAFSEHILNNMIRPYGKIVWDDADIHSMQWVFAIKKGCKNPFLLALELENWDINYKNSKDDKDE